MSTRRRTNMKFLATLALLSLCACASTSSTGTTTAGTSTTGKNMEMRSCSAPYVPAVTDTNVNVFERPDSTSVVLASIPVRQSVCAGTTSVGFGFRRVRLPNGTEGYVAASDLSDS
jgi:hypothetical protein